MTEPRRTLYPVLVYRDAEAAIEFLCSAFGFTEHVLYRDESGVLTHSEFILDTGMIMVGQEGVGTAADVVRTSLYVAVDDADAHHAQALQAGATIVKPPFDTDYGSRDYEARDTEGNTWYFGTYRP